VSEGNSPEESRRDLDATETIIKRCLGQLVFGQEEEELPHAIVRLLADHGLTLATGESGSGGLMAAWLSEVDPQGKEFAGGVVRRTAVIDNGPATANLAQEVRRTFQADLGLALSDFPPSDAGGDGGKLGDIFIALASEKGVSGTSHPYAGHPEILRPRAVKQALNFLRLAFIERQL
jgi:nicotinamide-nucleotide amidase